MDVTDVMCLIARAKAVLPSIVPPRTSLPLLGVECLIVARAETACLKIRYVLILGVLVFVFKKSCLL